MVGLYFIKFYLYLLIIAKQQVIVFIAFKNVLVIFEKTN